MDRYDDSVEYGNYDIKGMDPYAMLLQMKSWHTEIRSTVTSSVDGLQTQIIQNANEIVNRVTYENYTGEMVASMIVQDAYSINMLAQELNLRGLVTFSDLANTGSTVIHGSNIITGTVIADKLAVAEISSISANLGIITAGIINGLQINSANIAVSEDVRVGRYLYVGYGHDVVEKGVRFVGTAIGLTAYGDTLDINSGFTRFLGRTDFLQAVDFNNVAVTGLNVPRMYHSHQDGTTFEITSTGMVVRTPSGTTRTLQFV